MKQIARNFLVGFAVGSLGVFAWTGAAVHASPQTPAAQYAAR